MTTTVPPRRRALAAALAATALALSACGTTQPESTVLEQHGLAGMDAPEIIEHLDTMAVSDRPTTLIASVQPTELVLSDTAAGSTQTLPMPDETFYLSVAPYEAQTHDCTFHSLTTCLGEMTGESVDVTVTDAAGRTILDETRTTYDNGFVGLWLPRDITGTIRIEHDGKTASTPIATGADDLTCLTTMQLT
ncbi:MULTISPECIES: CueP family metal-binding protein [Dietzia]|uniref:CueP family metal-binding protein n=1 Tax=Dietzia cinnamea TaxID=321318 RepID=A0AAW5Q375_9ACTN|nr:MULTISPECIES: CueP family metal-binding protein [Dietzia]MBM7231449.1 CueP family metal-binding protein [Dietzia cinnamea]MCT1865158.1 CueP family metal-binding protein [Dietzia cinnamea]MCT2031129.1 CueP family metal-binding protein [Dietzia cinnamea]MCT2034661.1 CueP family metal-binding protein [Dietzia cinnamea]MCT2062647.1 CueP family metal-binding protein [Dietzia cinnamea]